MDRGNPADHPGHSAIGCRAQLPVVAHRYGTSSNGYACRVTGGHCVPTDNCKKLLEAFDNNILEKNKVIYGPN